MNMGRNQIEESLRLLDARLAHNGASPVGLVVCGGAALLVMDLLSRTTADVDVVALMSASQNLTSPAPFPEALEIAAREVALTMQLPDNWLNNAPSRDEGGLFQMGLPAGFRERLHPREYGTHLTAYFIDRIDQIHFKLYAAVDRGGYHISDLEALRPTTGELVQAAKWTLTHDVSPEFRMLLKGLLERLGHGNAAQEI